MTETLEKIIYSKDSEFSKEYNEKICKQNHGVPYIFLTKLYQDLAMKNESELEKLKIEFSNNSKSIFFKFEKN